jgi:hypothetical protein
MSNLLLAAKETHCFSYYVGSRIQYKISNYMSVDHSTSTIEFQFLGDETKLVVYSQLVKPRNCREVTT